MFDKLINLVKTSATAVTQFTQEQLCQFGAKRCVNGFIQQFLGSEISTDSYQLIGANADGYLWSSFENIKSVFNQELGKNVDVQKSCIEIYNECGISYLYDAVVESNPWVPYVAIASGVVGASIIAYSTFKCCRK